MGSEKMLVIIPRFLPIVGGAEVFIYRLCKVLGGKGVGVAVLTTRLVPGLPGREVLEGIHVSRVGRPGGWRLWDCITILPLFISRTRKRFNAMLIVGIDFFSLFSALAGKLLGKRVYFRPATALDLTVDMPELEFYSKSRFYRFSYRLLKRAMVKLLPRLADGWVALSGEIIAEMEQAGISKDNIRYIPNGVDTELFRPVGEAARKKLRESLSIPQEAAVLMFCGRLVKRKGVRMLSEAFSSLAQRHPELFLLLLGSGMHQPDSVEDDVRKMMRMECLRDRTCWIPQDPDTAKYYQASDIFVLPSEREGMPNVLLEAMSTALPSVARAIGGVTDIVEDGRNGLLFRAEEELGEAIEKLLADEKLRDVVSTNARQSMLESYSIHKTAAAYRDFLFG
jgi:glycosyltransferase involved in cell wall biosynthesis